MTAGSDGKQKATDAQWGREVTFAFTDIEGSTTRWESDRVAMQDAVRRHDDAVVQAAIAQRGGHVFKTGGDAFCSVFAAPQDAVGARQPQWGSMWTGKRSPLPALPDRSGIKC
jgi:class 3 adenylate cyclase